MSDIALVTGASAGIGRAVADRLAADSWIVIGASRRGTPGATWKGLVMDVDDDDSVAGGVGGILRAHGRLDAVIACAGFGVAGPSETTPIEEARAQLETNYWGAVRPVHAALPSMRERGRGRIVLMSSIGGVVALPFQSFYSASKFALEGWAEALAYEIGPFGLDVTLVQPGNVATDFTDHRRTTATEAWSDYRDAATRAIDAMAADERSGITADTVARTVAEVLGPGRPPRRVSVGRPGERIGLLAKRLLPARAFEAAARSSLGL